MKILRSAGPASLALRLRAGATPRIALACLLAVLSQSALAERVLSALPHREAFDTGDYASELVWVVQGATHTWLPTGGWRGGAAKFTPPLSDQGMAGLGQFHLSGLAEIPEQLNVRFLIWHGPDWHRYGTGNKLVIMNRDGNPGRPMIITRFWEPVPPTRWETWGACDGTVCRYEGGDFWPDGTDRLRIGDPPLGRAGEWISVELEANTQTGMIRLYVDTEDGALSGLYVERPMDDTGAGGVWSYIDTVGGYMGATTQASPDNYYLIDEVVIDAGYIGPPAGFVTCCFGDGFESQSARPGRSARASAIR